MSWEDKNFNLFIILRKAGEEKRQEGRRKKGKKEGKRKREGGKKKEGRKEKERWKEKASSNLINLESLSLCLRPRCSSILLHVNRALFW